jgi:peptidoglycan/LPS O-acetylase OafA/YrhL
MKAKPLKLEQTLLAKAKSAHIPALDGIRGLAILMVLMVHFLEIVDPTTGLQVWLNRVAGYGTMGIDLFFILSGFLITGILLDTRDKPNFFRNFFIRRVLRIFPLYYLILALFYGVLLFGLDPIARAPYAKALDAQPWAWTYLFNFFIAKEGAWTVPYIGHFWSLAVEEQFYMVWPFVVFYLPRGRLIPVCLLLIAASTLCQVYLEIIGVSPVAIHVLTPCRINALCLGALLAAWIRRPEVAQADNAVVLRTATVLALGAITAKVLLIVVMRLVPAMDKSLEALRALSWLGLFGALHLAAVASSAKSLVVRALTAKPLLFLGKYSYGIYIFHHFLSWPSKFYNTVGQLTEVIGNQNLAILVNSAVGIGLSTFIAWVSFQVFESRFLKLKDVFAPPIRAVPAAA